MINSDKINYLISNSNKLFYEYIKLEEIQNEYKRFFERYTQKEIALIPDVIDVRCNLKSEVEFHIIRNDVIFAKDPSFIIGRYDVHFDIENKLTDEKFDIFESSLNLYNN